MRSFFKPKNLAICLVLLGLGAVVSAQTVSSTRFEAGGELFGGASLITDGLASGGNYVVFYQQNTPGQVGDCGLQGQVFCENFESGPTTSRQRTGDWDSSKFSAARLSGGDNVNWVGRALIPAGCRPGSITDPLPPDDTLICEPTTIRNSRHGLTATTVQNYGDNQYRINQPFDFSNRTGIFRFDADIHHKNDGLLGTAVVTLSDLPYSSTSIATENGNGSPQRNGLTLHFNFFNRCDPGNTTLPDVRLNLNYGETKLDDADGGYWDGCVADGGVKTKEGFMNRIELRLSQSKLEVWATDYSNDGLTFGPLKMMYESPPLNLPFTRGWWAIGGHNHASIKYQDRNNNIFMPSINTYWDNIAFDGPIITTPKVYQVQHANTADGNGVRLGHPFTNAGEPVMSALTIAGVDKAAKTSARLTFSSWAVTYWNTIESQRLFYRLNGGAWHRVVYPVDMINALMSRQPARLNHVIDVNMSELVNGDNTLQFQGEGFNNSYQSFVANIDLQLE